MPWLGCSLKCSILSLTLISLTKAANVTVVGPKVPAALDSVLTFHAEIKSSDVGDTEAPPYKYRFEWKVKDDLLANSTSNATSDTLNQIFQRASYKSGCYHMVVHVFFLNVTGNKSAEEEVGSASVEFTLTDDVNGVFKVTQPRQLHTDPQLYSTQHWLGFDVTITDKFPSSSTVEYIFFANTTRLKALNSSQQHTQYNRTEGLRVAGKCKLSVQIQVKDKKGQMIMKKTFEQNHILKDEVTSASYIGSSLYYSTEEVEGFIVCGGSPPFNITVWLQLIGPMPPRYLERSSESLAASGTVLRAVNLSQCNYMFNFGKVPVHWYRLDAKISNQINTNNANFTVSVQYPAYYVPPVEPLVIVVAILFALAAAILLFVVYIKDRQPQRPSFIVETAQPHLYQPDNGDPSFAKWLAGGSDSYFNQAKDWLQQRRNQRNNGSSDYHPIVEEQREVLT